jgi:hypothetical protein
MSDFRIFFVGTAAARPGKGSECATWWREKGQAYFESFPGVKSLQAFASQFGLGRRHGFEFWFEIEDYAVLSQWDTGMAANPQKYGPLWVEYVELFETGPNRIVGDWPESRLLP